MQTDRLIGIMNQIICCEDTGEILRLARGYFGNPLILADVSYSIQAITDESQVQDPNWSELVRSRCVPIASLSCPDISHTYESSRVSGEPVLDCIPGDALPILRKTLVAGGRVVGYLNSPFYFDMPSQEQKDFFNLLGNLLAGRLLQRNPEHTYDESGLDYFVYDLLEGNITDQTGIRARLKHFGWNPLAAGKIHIVCIYCLNQGPDCVKEFGRLAHRLSKAFPSCRIFSYGAELKMICPAGMALKTEGESFVQLERMLDKTKVSAGVSRPLRYLEHVVDFNRQAKKAAELGHCLEHDRALHFFDHLSIYYMLELAAQHDAIDQFIHSAILLLRDYDREHDTLLLNTLEVYLTHNQSIGESASALYIHRNTMNYRISKIIELTRVDLADASVVTQLLFSFYTLRYHELTGMGEMSLPADDSVKMRKKESGTKKKERLA